MLGSAKKKIIIRFPFKFIATFNFSPREEGKGEIALIEKNKKKELKIAIIRCTWMVADVNNKISFNPIFFLFFAFLEIETFPW